MLASVGVAASYWQRSWGCFINNKVMKQANTTKQPNSKEGLHTQGEWETGSELPGDEYKCCILNEEGRLLAQTFTNPYYSVETAEANAELIVRAVNERKALLDSHRELLENLERILDRIGENGYQHDFPSAYERAVIALNNAKNI